MNILRPPYIKPKGFCPNPIARYGLPKNVDASINPKVVHTQEYQQFFEQELYYIKNGYTTGGMWIPGRYYYYLNYGTFGTVKGHIYPHICDLHLEMAFIIDYCKKEHRNFIGPKKRRGGITEAFMRMVSDYHYRFDLKYKCGIAAGVEKHVKVFRKKWENHDATIIPEFRIKSVDNKEEKIAQYELKTPTGEVKAGTFNAMLFKTAFQNTNVYKGEELNDVIAEESGEFEKIAGYYSDSEDCMMFGTEQVGNFWAWGTGGNMTGASKHFEQMWHDYEDYNMVRFFIPATRFYFPFYGGAPDDGKNAENVPNLMSLTQEQRIGVEDIVAAEEDIKKRRDKLAKSGNIKKYIEFCQNNPLTIQEVFQRASSNHFDIETLNRVGFELESNDPKYIKYKLEYDKNDNGEIIMPYKVNLVPAKNLDDEKECVLISLNGHFQPNGGRLYCAGVDSYDLDQSKVSKSLGAMCVRIRDNDIPGAPKRKPVAIIRCRPPRKEVFYEMCFKLAIYYNLIGAVQIDIRNSLIFEYFKRMGGEKYLARRPVKFESVNSEQGHEYGFALTIHSKPKMVSVMQTEVLDRGDAIDFPKLIEELKNYDEIEVDSDNDLADAYGISLIQDISMGSKPMSEEEMNERNDRLTLNKHDSGADNLSAFFPEYDNGALGRAMNKDEE